MRAIPLLFFLILANFIFAQSQFYDSLTTIPFSNKIKDLEFSENDRNLFICTKDSIFVYHLFDQALHTLELNHSYDSIWYYQVKITRNGRFLAFYNIDNDIFIYRKKGRKTYEPFETLTGSKWRVPALTISEDGKLLASGGPYGEVNLWNLPKGEFIKSLDTGANGAVYSLGFSHHNKRLAIGNGSSECVQIDIKVDTIISKLNLAEYQPDKSVAWSTQIPGQIIYSPDNQAISMRIHNKFNSLIIWNANSDGKYSARFSSFKTNEFTQTQNELIAGDELGKIHILDIRKKKKIESFQAHKRGILKIEVSKSGTYLASSGEGGEVIIWKRKSE